MLELDFQTWVKLPRPPSAYLSEIIGLFLRFSCLNAKMQAGLEFMIIK